MAPVQAPSAEPTVQVATPSAVIRRVVRAAAPVAETRAVPAALMAPLQAASLISEQALSAVAHWVLRLCLRAWRGGYGLRCARQAHCPSREPATAYPCLPARMVPVHCR